MLCYSLTTMGNLRNSASHRRSVISDRWGSFARNCDGTQESVLSPCASSSTAAGTHCADGLVLQRDAMVTHVPCAYPSHPTWWSNEAGPRQASAPRSQPCTENSQGIPRWHRRHGVERALLLPTVLCEHNVASRPSACAQQRDPPCQAPTNKLGR